MIEGPKAYDFQAFARQLSQQQVGRGLARCIRIGWFKSSVFIDRAVQTSERVAVDFRAAHEDEARLRTMAKSRIGEVHRATKIHLPSRSGGSRSLPHIRYRRQMNDCARIEPSNQGINRTFIANINSDTAFKVAIDFDFTGTRPNRKNAGIRRKNRNQGLPEPTTDKATCAGN